jgi:hypothetical protein
MNAQQQPQQERLLKAILDFFLVLTIGGPIFCGIGFISGLISWASVGDSGTDPSTPVQIFLLTFSVSSLLYYGIFLFLGGLLLFIFGVLGLMGVGFYPVIFRSRPPQSSRPYHQIGHQPHQPAIRPPYQQTPQEPSTPSTYREY